MSVDEGMIKYKGRVSILQYMPKTIKRGMKVRISYRYIMLKQQCQPIQLQVWILAEAKSGIVLKFSVYIGKGTDLDSTDDDNSSGAYLGQRVVYALTRKYHDKGHHVYMDNFFTSSQLLEALSEDLWVWNC